MSDRRESGKDVFAMFMDDVGVPKAKSKTSTFTGESTYGDVTYSRNEIESERLDLSEDWKLHEIMKPKDLKGLNLLLSNNEGWIIWTVEDLNDDDYGKTYFESLKSGTTKWELKGVKVRTGSTLPPITPSLSEDKNGRRRSSYIASRTPRSKSNVSTFSTLSSTSSDADILGTAVPRNSVLAGLSMRSPGIIDTPSPGIPRRPIGKNRRHSSFSSSMRKRRKSSLLIKAVESSAKRRNSVSPRSSMNRPSPLTDFIKSDDVDALTSTRSSNSLVSVDEPSPRSRFSRRESVLGLLSSDESSFYRTIYQKGRKDCGEDLVDVLREKGFNKSQIALMRLYHCISIIEHKSRSFRRRMNISRERESRVVVMEILNSRPALRKGTYLLRYEKDEETEYLYLSLFPSFTFTDTSTVSPLENSGNLLNCWVSILFIMSFLLILLIL